MSIEAKFRSSAEAKKNGWFSRRHESSDAHRDEIAKRDVEKDERKAREQAQREKTEAKKEASRKQFASYAEQRRVEAQQKKG